MNSKETFSTLMMDKNFWPEWINSASSIPHEKHRKTSKNIEKHRKTSTLNRRQKMIRKIRSENTFFLAASTRC
jgi:hypothetical protein